MSLSLHDVLGKVILISGRGRKWRPVILDGAVKMRRLSKDGVLIYREPTDTELKDYLENEAW